MASDSKLTSDWLNAADSDLSFAKEVLSGDLEYYGQICFYLHQAAEKYLKAYIVSNKLDFRKIHDLTTLVGICAQKDQAFGSL